MKSCEWFQEKMLDIDILDKEEKNLLDAHLAKCENCSKDYYELQSLGNFMQIDEKHTVSNKISHNLLNEFDKQFPPPKTISYTKLFYLAALFLFTCTIFYFANNFQNKKLIQKNEIYEWEVIYGSDRTVEIYQGDSVSVVGDETIDVFWENDGVTIDIPGERE